MSERSVTFGDGLVGIINGVGKRGTVIITHGAGQGMQSSILAKTASELAERDFRVLRFNFAYLERKSAPSAGGVKELPNLLEAIDFIKGSGNVILVGKSFGARVAANAALARTEVGALVFYGMPLKGASKTAKPRDWSHLAKLTVPMLFVTGDKDQLCPLPQLGEVLATINAPVSSETVPGDHSFKPRSEDVAVSLAVQWIERQGQ